MALSDLDIAKAAVAAGFRGTSVATAVAVALAESGGDPTQRNTNTDGSIDRGLWQINNKAHPDVTDAEADNPATAAKAAYKISQGGRSWRPWVAYTNGSYKRYANRAAKAGAAALALNPRDLLAGLPVVGGLADAPGMDAMAGLAKAVASVGSVVIKAGEWIGNPRNWVRIAEVVGGAAAVAVGLVLISRSDAQGPAVSAIRGGTKAAAKVGKAAKGAAKAGAEVGAAVATGGASAAASAGKLGKTAATAAAAKAAKAKAPDISPGKVYPK
jgi:hypothetical protein